MMKANINRVSISLIQDARKPIMGTDLFPLYYRLSYKGKKKYIGTGKNLKTNDWGDKFFTARRGKLADTRQELQNEFERICETVKKIFEKRKPFSYELLMQMLGNQKISSIYSLFEFKIEELKKKNKIGTIYPYQATLDNFKRFTEKDILPDQITLDFLKSYEYWMLNNGSEYGGVGFYMRHFRTIVNIAKRNEMITPEQYPFGEGKYQIPKVKAKIKSLSSEQIKDIILKEPVKEGSQKQRDLDLWLFSFFGNGINAFDLCSLKWSDIYEDEISFYRHKTIDTAKTKIEIHIPLTPPIQEIMDRLSNKKKSGLIFPFFPSDNISLTEKKKIVDKIVRDIKRTLTRIGKRNNIGNISMYTARHSHVRAKIRKNKADPAAIMEDLGHSNYSSTAVYFPRTTKEERFKNASNLL